MSEESVKEVTIVTKNEEEAKAKMEATSTEVKKTVKVLSNKEKEKRGGRKHIPGPSRLNKKLTALDKMNILEKIAEGKNLSQIAEEMQRTRPTIYKAVNELKEKTKAAFGQEISTGIGNDILSTVNYFETEAFNRIINKMVSMGLETEIARSRVIKVMNTAQTTGIEEVSEAELYSAAMGTVAGKELFGKSSDKGTADITISTTATSERGDLLTGGMNPANNARRTSNIKDHIDGNRVFRI